MAWISYDTQSILSISKHIITHNPRISVVYDGHNTWTLKIQKIKINEAGSYLCQINTDPMMLQTAYINVGKKKL